METLKDAPRGTWCLVQAYNKNPNYERLRNQHRQQRHSTPFVPLLDDPAEKCGYIVFKDSKVVVFYTNDLASNPPEHVVQGSDERAWTFVHGLAKISRWTGNEKMHHNDFLVAAPFVAYNMFMNGVNRMDQYQSALATQRKEKRLHMTIFTFLMDLGISQAFPVHQKIADERNEPAQHNFFEFKRKVCESLIWEL